MISLSLIVIRSSKAFPGGQSGEVHDFHTFDVSARSNHIYDVICNTSTLSFQLL